MVIINDLRPTFSFVTRIDGLMVQIKPYFSYYQWLDWIDLSTLDQSAEIELINASLVTIEANVEAAQTAAGLAQVAADNAAGANGKLARFNAFGDEFEWIAGSRTIAITDLAPYNLFVGSTTNFARAEINVPLMAGTWTFWIMTMRRNDVANLSFYVDGVIYINALNLYKTAPPEYAYITSVTGVTVPDEPLIDLEIWADNKHASSSGYVLTVTKIWGLRTGA